MDKVVIENLVLEIQQYLEKEPNKLLPNEIDKLNKLCNIYNINYIFLIPEIISNKSSEQDFIISKKIKYIYYSNYGHFIKAKL
jgi:hypothetical protein